MLLLILSRIELFQTSSLFAESYSTTLLVKVSTSCASTALMIASRVFASRDVANAGSSPEYFSSARFAATMSVLHNWHKTARNAWSLKFHFVRLLSRQVVAS
eukprot:Mycagemm_TRINITY_DN4112_c0_g1::TRINITY_DN4112_c0_g1_i1::g.4700::m.4700 type:complete len:102 gc:universal TRINITY_DN4112_c0_g1_i1:564-259(-)